MLRDADKMVLAYLRNNARSKITEIAEKTNIPVTTIYDKVRAHEEDGMIKRHIALLSFNKFGFQTRFHFAVRVRKDSKKALQKFLIEQPNINSLYKLGYGYDFLFEGIFKNLSESENFVERLEERFGVKEIKKFHVIEELKEEEFLSKPEHFEFLE